MYTHQTKRRLRELAAAIGMGDEGGLAGGGAADLALAYVLAALSFGDGFDLSPFGLLGGSTEPRVPCHTLQSEHRKKISCVRERDD